MAALFLIFALTPLGSSSLRLRQFAQTGTALEIILTTSSGDQIAPQTIRRGIEDLASQLARGVGKNQMLRVGVADFTNLRGIPTDEGRFIADRLTTILSRNPQFVVIERQQFLEALSERNLVIADLANRERAREIAAALNAQAFILGTISVLEDEVDVDARLVNAQTGDIRSSASVALKKRSEITIVEEEREKVISAPKGPLLDFRFPQVIHDRDLAFELQFCEIKEVVIVCRVTAWNTGNKERTISVNRKQSYLVGATGRQYTLKQADPFSDDPPARRFGGWDLPPGTRRALDLTFGIQGVPEDRDISSIVIEFDSYPNGRGFPDTPQIVFKRS